MTSNDIVRSRPLPAASAWRDIGQPYHAVEAIDLESAHLQEFSSERLIEQGKPLCGNCEQPDS